MQARLPKDFIYKKANDLIRIGRNFDGGYLISKNDLLKSNLLISLGINDDWSFEKQFTNYKNVPVFAFDGTVGAKIFFKKIIRNSLFLKPIKIFDSLKIFLSYCFFFRDDKKHFKKNITGNFKLHHSNTITMREVFELSNGDKIFLKIDIEGHEYRALEDIINNESRLTGLAIEFHDCDLHIEKIKKFVKDLSLNLIHIHANNKGKICSQTGIPTALEMTFSNNSNLTKENVITPNKLDMPNDKSIEEIKIKFN